MLLRPFSFAFFAIVLTSSAVCGQPKQLNGTRQYLYLSDQRILTLEVVNSEKVILNYVNIGEAYDLVEAPMVVLVDQSGHGFRAQVILVEPLIDPMERYTASDLLPPRKFKGYTIFGDFRIQEPVAQAYFKTGGRVLQLEPMTADDFEKAAGMVGSVDLSSEDPKAAVVNAGFRRGFGKMYFAGTPEAAEVEKWFPEVEVLGPVPLQRPAPKLPAKYGQLPDPVVVELKLLVGKAGGLYEFQVAKAPNPELGEMAKDTVQNSWRFLPAVSKGQVADASVTLRVVFER